VPPALIGAQIRSAECARRPLIAFLFLFMRRSADSSSPFDLLFVWFSRSLQTHTLTHFFVSKIHQARDRPLQLREIEGIGL